MNIKFINFKDDIGSIYITQKKSQNCPYNQFS